MLHGSKSIKRLVLVPLIFLITLSVSGYSLAYKNQMGIKGAEEYYLIAIHLLKTGSLGLEQGYPSTSVFRPPGYSFFVAAVLKTWGEMTGKESTLISFKDPKVTEESYRVIYFAQALLLSLSAVVLFLWLSMNISLGTSFIIALLFGCNPYMIIIAGRPHYEILHVFLMLTASFSLYYAAVRHHESSWKMVLPGILWGFATLTRPTTLIMPAFIILLFLILFKDSMRKVIRLSALFIVGMSIVIAPYTVRNYRITENIIPVNAQSGVTLWAGTVTKLERDPNHFRWVKLWFEHGCPIYLRLMPRESYQGNVDKIFDLCAVQYICYALPADRLFKEEAINNISHNPSIYLYNVINNFITFNIDINSVIIKSFQAIQDGYDRIDLKWYEYNHPQDFYSSDGQKLFEIFFYVLTVFSFLGLLLFIRRGYAWYRSPHDIHPELQGTDSSPAMEGIPETEKHEERFSHGVSSKSFLQENAYFLVAVTIYLTYSIAHSITYMDFWYYYNKFPFLFLFTGYFLHETESFTLAGNMKLTGLLNASLAILGVLLLLVIIL